MGEFMEDRDFYLSEEIIFFEWNKEEKRMTNINTTATMKKTSAMLMGKCEKTQKNLRRMMAEAGCADGEVMKVMLPLTPGSRDDVVFAGLNGVSFYFLRGKECQMPAAVAEILKSCGEM